MPRFVRMRAPHGAEADIPRSAVARKQSRGWTAVEDVPAAMPDEPAPEPEPAQEPATPDTPEHEE
jgi:hypothetical protein